MQTAALFYYDSADSPAFNMAKDEYLLSTITCPTLRFYDWDQATVSIGYFQNHSIAALEGLSYVRRATGGGLVDHRNDLTFSLILPIDHHFIQCRCESYLLINSVIKDVFEEFNISSYTEPRWFVKSITIRLPQLNVLLDK